MNLHDGTPGLIWGSITSLGVKAFMPMLQIVTIPDETVDHIVNTIVTASLGGTVGFFVHLFWKTVVDRIKNTKEKTDEKENSGKA